MLVVDAADHLSPSTLAGLLEQASSTRTKVVLVPGGTVPGHGPSLAHSLDQLLEQLPSPGLPGAEAVVKHLLERPAHPAVSVPGVGVQGCVTGAAAMSHMIAAWADMDREEGQSPLMVAFGPDEVEALNRAARSVQRGLAGRADRPPLASEMGPSELLLGDRRYAVGDPVLALRRIGPVRSATTGTVAALGRVSVSVEWQIEAGTWRSEVGSDQALSLGYGYATTVPYLRSCEDGGQEFLVLGDPLELASRSDRGRAVWVPVPGPGLPLSGPAAVSARHRTAVAELATSWPDRDMLERAGPRPLDEIERRRWTERIVSCALERALGLANLGMANLGMADLGMADLGMRESVHSPAACRSLAPRPTPSAQVPGL